MLYCASGGGDGAGPDDGDGGWWMLDDSTVAPVTTAAALCRPRQYSDAAYVLLYRMPETVAAGGRPPALTALSRPPFSLYGEAGYVSDLVHHYCMF